MRKNLSFLALLALLCFFCTVLVVQAQTQCPSACTCMLPSDAKLKGYSLCGGKQIICGYDKTQNPLYCYQKPATTIATTKPTTTPTPATTPCPSACSCMLPDEAKKAGYTLCGGKQTLCGYDQNKNPQYCYQKPVTLAPATLPGTLVTPTRETIEAVPIRTVLPTETIPMAVVTARCTISGNIYRFFHDPETLKIQVTNLDSGDVSLYSVTPVYSGDLVSHYAYTIIARCDGNYQLEPVYQASTGACAWTGSFSGDPVVHMTGSSASGRDFTYVPVDANVPDVSVYADPEEPGVDEDVRITVEGVDDNSIVFMAAKYDLVYRDGSRRSVDWRELTPTPAAAFRAGERASWTGRFDITENGLARAEITARVCDRGGNERWGSGVVTWASCAWCGDHVIPIEVNGNPVDKIDVIFIPDTSYAGDMTALVEDIHDVIENGYYQNDLFSDNRGKFNFYYLDDEATVTAYPACGFTPPLGSCEDFQDATTFADSIAVLHTTDFRDWSGTKCGRSVFCSEPTSYRTFVHESGHSLFGLKDEYCCDSHYSQNDPNPNIWETETACENDATAEGWDPDDCTPFCPSGSGNCGSGFWKIDPDRCVMRCSQSCSSNCCLACGGAGAMCQYEDVCARRVNAVLSEYV